MLSKSIIITIAVVVGIFLLITLASCLGGGYYAAANNGRRQRGEILLIVPCFFVLWYWVLKASCCIDCSKFHCLRKWRHKRGLVEKRGPITGTLAGLTGPQRAERVPVGDALV